MNVTDSQMTVLETTVISITQASVRRSPAGKRPRIAQIATSEMTNDAIIALISLHALMRHQYQRRMSTSPVPDPSARRDFHAASTVSRCIVTKIEARNRETVAQRDTDT